MQSVNKVHQWMLLVGERGVVRHKETVHLELQQCPGRSKPGHDLLIGSRDLSICHLQDQTSECKFEQTQLLAQSSSLLPSISCRGAPAKCLPGARSPE